jgi:hypothetical protein
VPGENRRNPVVPAVWPRKITLREERLTVLDAIDMAPITASQHDSLYRARTGILAPVHADDSRRTSPPGLMPEDAGNLVDGETTVTRYHVARIL